MSPRALHLCCVLLVMFSGFTLASQNCSTSVYQTYDDLNACLTSVPYNETVKTSTLATLRAIIPSYVFVDSVQNSPDPVHIPISVNLQSGLDQIETTNYTTDVALQEAFATLFTQLEDAHTRYTKPIDPYCKSSFVLPFTFYSRVNGTHQNIYLKIRQELLDRYIELYPPFSSTNIDGYQVISLDGEDPVAAIGTFANTSVGYSKDYSARFNLAIDGYGRDFPPMYTWRNQSLQSIPSSATITLDVMDTQGTTTSLQVYWMGVFDEYYPINITDVGQVGVHQLQYFEKILGLDLSRDNEEPEGDPDVYYTMVDENTGVLRIYTFEPKDSGEFIATVEEAVCFFKNQSISRLIIDVSQNGGGSICLGYAVEKFLFPDLEPATGAYDIKASDLFIEFATEAASQICSNVTHQLCGVNPEAVGYFTPCAWFDWYSKDMYYDDTWFIPGKTVTRGGIPGQYSSFITQGCETEFSRWIPGAATKLDLSAGNVIIVSDGLCGSTCSVFARHIQLNNRAKSITTGGVLGTQQPSLTSFPGGEVVHLSYIQELAKRYGLLDSPLVPPPLPTTADFRFAIREIFGWDDILDSSVPQEFTYVPANWQVFYEQPFENRTAVWNSVLPYFDKCDQSLNPPCHVPNGVGKLRCENETTSDTTCITVACNPGYELTINGTCEKCPIGYYSAGISGAACKLCPTLIPENCKFSEDGVTSPVCPFICSDCESCAAYETDANPTLNTVCMETWAFCLLLVAVIIISASTSGVLSSFLTVRYYGRQAAARHFYD